MVESVDGRHPLLDVPTDVLIKQAGDSLHIDRWRKLDFSGGSDAKSTVEGALWVVGGTLGVLVAADVLLQVYGGSATRPLSANRVFAHPCPTMDENNKCIPPSTNTPEKPKPTEQKPPATAVATSSPTPQEIPSPAPTMPTPDIVVPQPPGGGETNPPGGNTPARPAGTPVVPLEASVCQSLEVPHREIPLIPDDSHPEKESLYKLGRETGVFTGGPEAISTETAQQFFDSQFAGKSQAEINQILLNWEKEISSRMATCMKPPATQPPATATATIIIPSPTATGTLTPTPFTPDTPTPTPTPMVTFTPTLTPTPARPPAQVPVQLPGAGEGYLVAGMMMGADATAALPLLSTMLFATAKAKLFRRRR